MNEPIAAGALILMASLAVLTVAVRAWPHPGQRAAAVEVPFAELMPDWPEPAYGAAVPQAFAHCRGCRGVTSIALHPGAHTCEAGHVTITAIGGHR